MEEDFEVLNSRGIWVLVPGSMNPYRSPEVLTPIPAAPMKGRLGSSKRGMFFGVAMIVSGIGMSVGALMGVGVITNYFSEVDPRDHSTHPTFYVAVIAGILGLFIAILGIAWFLLPLYRFLKIKMEVARMRSA